MSSIEAFNPRELLQFRYDLDIPAFVETAVAHNLDKEEVLIYLHIITNTLDGSDKMWRFVPVAKAEGLTREEILVWLHVSYGGLLDSEHLSRKLRIPLRFAENALVVLREKGLIGEGCVL